MQKEHTHQTLLLLWVKSKPLPKLRLEPKMRKPKAIEEIRRNKRETKKDVEMGIL